MKKTSIILIVLVLAIIIALSGWYLFLRTPDIPVGETILNILPFGSDINAKRPTTNAPKSFGDTQNKPFGTDQFSNPTTKLFRISREPVAGAVVLNRGASSSTSSFDSAQDESPQATTVVRYVDRATGHIYDTDLATLSKTKVANQTLPKIYEAYFRADGNAVLLRSLKENSDVVENTAIMLNPPKAGGADTLYSATSTILSGDISSVAVGSGNSLFYVLRNTSSLVTSAFNGAGLKTLLNSPFKDWRLSSTGNSLVAYTKASAGTAGFAYTINTSKGTLTKILGPLDALVVIIDASGSRILYSYVEDNKTKLFAKNLKSNTLAEILPATLAEKCIWSLKNTDRLFCAVPTLGPETGEPDSWYRGLTHFSDQIWFFETKVNITHVLVEPKPTLDIDIDAVELKLSLNEDYLVFINKTDLSLWALRLEQF